MRKISDDRARYVVEHFATDNNASIIRATGLSIPTIYRIAREAGVTRSDEFRAKAYGTIVLTEEQTEMLVSRFPDTDNWTLASDLGISETSLHRYARALGLRKSKAYMRQCNRESLSAMHYANAKHGHWPQKGVYNENLRGGVAYQFRAGENNRMRNGIANERRRLEKARATRLTTILEERKRLRMGLAPRTRMRLRVREAPRYGGAEI